MANDNELLVKIKGLDELSPVMLKAMASMETAATKLTESIEKINPSLDKNKDKAEGLNTGMVNLASGLSVVRQAIDAGVAAWNAISGEIGHAVDEAIEAEHAMNQLNGALVSQGLYTQKTVDALDSYVKKTEELTGVSGQVIQKMIAMGVQMGLSVEQSKQMEEASRKLAAATGVDVMTAFSQMQGAMNGQVRSLAKVIPGVKDLTEAQLKQGAAIKLVSEGLDAQYQLYQGSFSASLARAKTAVENVYQNFGQIIIQNPVIIRGLNLFTEWMGKLADSIQVAGKWVAEHQDQIEKFGAAFVKAIAILGSAAAIIGVVTFGLEALGAAFAFATGPIGLTILAVGALTAAFYKWPGLFDEIAGSFKFFVGMFLEGISYIADKAASLVGIFNKDLAASLKNISNGINDQSDKWKMAGSAQIEYGNNANQASDTAVVALDKEGKAIDKTLEKQSKLNAAKKEATKSFGGVDIGTSKERETGKAEVSTRDKDLKDFQDFLAAKKRMAVSSEQEQQTEIDKVRAEALKNSSGPQASTAKNQVEMDAEKNKQSELKAMRDAGILDEAQYQESILSSQQKYAQLEQNQALVNREALADALGTSEAAFQQKQGIEEERFQLELQQKLDRAALLGATDEELQALKDDAEAQHRQQELDALDAHNQEIASREGTAWDGVVATRQNYYRSLEKAADDHYKKFLSGVALMEAAQGAYNTTTQKLGDALVKNEKITASKFVGVFLEALGRKIQMDGFANLLLGTAMSVMLNPQGPALIGAAGAEIIGGTALARLGVSMQGGQADEGMDAVPGSLAGKSFVLSQGERVVQPAANKDLTEFLRKDKASDNGGGKGQTINITLNYGGMGTASDARNMAEILVKEIRSMSERGTPIMSDKGLIKS